MKQISLSEAWDNAKKVKEEAEKRTADRIEFDNLPTEEAIAKIWKDLTEEEWQKFHDAINEL